MGKSTTGGHTPLHRCFSTGTAVVVPFETKKGGDMGGHRHAHHGFAIADALCEKQRPGVHVIAIIELGNDLKVTK